MVRTVQKVFPEDSALILILILCDELDRKEGYFTSQRNGRLRHIPL